MQTVADRPEALRGGSTVCMVASKLGSATSLSQSAGRYPPPHGNLEGEPIWARTFDTIEELRAALSSSPGGHGPGSSPATVIVPSPGTAAQSQLDQTQWPI